MKYTISIILCMFLAILFSGTIPREIGPPGVVWIPEDLYMDELEVSNLDWQEYLYWLEETHGKNAQEYKNALPAPISWPNEPGFTQIDRFDHPAYNFHPVTGITYEQAQAFCAWRSDFVNYMLYLGDYRKNLDPNITRGNAPVKFTYRLPTKSEWEKVAGIGFPKRVQKMSSKGIQVHNLYNEEKDIGQLKKIKKRHGDQFLTTAPVKSSIKNGYGVYNILGNVAEMVEEKGIAKGASWKDKPDKVSVKKDINYSSPSNWLGFRCACERSK